MIISYISFAFVYTNLIQSLFIIVTKVRKLPLRLLNAGIQPLTKFSTTWQSLIRIIYNVLLTFCLFIKP